MTNRSRLQISAIEQKSDHAKIFCVLKIYLKKESRESLMFNADFLNVLELALSPTYTQLSFQV